ncbi:MAG: transketolase [Planctomycetaceae bacterium]|nr:transketolase [Planctomycetaceae bacterium]
MATCTVEELATVDELKAKAVELRKAILTMIHKANSGHPGGALSMADIVTALYFREMRLDPKNPKWADRDRFILSKGHACPVQYGALALKGCFPMDVINTLRVEGSILQGHPDMKRCPGIDISTGSLGQGLSCGVGMAIAGKRDKKDYRVFVAVGDGEAQEGQIWEAAQTAAKYELDNLVVIIDDNGLQCDGCCDEIMPTLDLGKKFEAFGFEVYPIDGHDMSQIVAVLDLIRGRAASGKPKCIHAKTHKGRGVSFMEDVVEWHGMAPNAEQYATAMADVERGLN